MSDYNDIAQRNPRGAVSVISSFGYEIQDRRNLGRSLNELVANEGEPALKAVMNIHPDKDIILELFGNKNPDQNTSSNCNCGSCSNRHNGGRQDQYMNATGNEPTATIEKNDTYSTTLAHQTNAILLIASLFIATALIIKTHK
jgi:hypothetical protein